jgi:hypothetical protein
VHDHLRPGPGHRLTGRGRIQPVPHHAIGAQPRQQIVVRCRLAERAMRWIARDCLLGMLDVSSWRRPRRTPRPVLSRASERAGTGCPGSAGAGAGRATRPVRTLDLSERGWVVRPLSRQPPSALVPG